MATKKHTQASRGGVERARRLAPERRSEIARRAALTRWVGEGKVMPEIAKYGAPDRPLRIGDIEIPCYVLANGTRVLAQRGLQGGIGLSEGGGKQGARKIAGLMAQLAERGVNVRDLVARANNPMRFIPPHGGNPADGYEASILTDICAVLIEAGLDGKLYARQLHLADRAAVLQHGFSEVGINALVDEATGYEEFRPRDALATILEAFVQRELRPWVRTFPPDFYREIFRLNGWVYWDGCPRPQVIGHFTNNIVYRRLAPGVLEELKRIAPRNDGGKLKNKLFQNLTGEIGHPKLLAHLSGVLMLMKYSPDWPTFMNRLDREFPQWGKNWLLAFPADYEASTRALPAAPT